MTDLKAGRRYRVTFEADAKNKAGGVALSFNGYNYAYPDELPENATFEELPPPVVQFEPGDRVKSKVDGREYTIAVNGYFDYANNQIVASSYKFTSEYHDKVD